mgnify:CR=1 FL=1
MLEKHNVQVLTSTALQEVHPDHFVVKRTEQMETLDFGLRLCLPGYACVFSGYGGAEADLCG